MAGKHISVSIADGVGNFRALNLAAPPQFPGTKRDRAYAEGRAAAERGESSGANPHFPDFSNPCFGIWASGHASRNPASAANYVGCQFQTATEDA